MPPSSSRRLSESLRQTLKYCVNDYVYRNAMVQIQVRVPEEVVEEIDRWVSKGRFRSRSDAIKTILALYDERQKTREFYKMLVERRREAREKPEVLVPLEDVE